MSDQDHQILEGFLDRTRDDVLEPLVKQAPQDDYGKYLRQAWEDVKPVFEEAKRQLREQRDDKLRDAGLSGNELQLKMFVFGSAIPVSLPRPWAWPVWPWDEYVTRKILQIINAILGSISSLVPIVHRIKEFKEMIEANIGQRD